MARFKNRRKYLVYKGHSLDARSNSYTTPTLFVDGYKEVRAHYQGGGTWSVRDNQTSELVAEVTCDEGFLIDYMIGLGIQIINDRLKVVDDE